MSATNRGSKRNESDFYITPQETIEIFLDNFKLRGEEILEPCAGNGAIVQAIRREYSSNVITAVEVRNELENLRRSGANWVYSENDFLNLYDSIDPQPETIITNPPYSIAQQIIEHCFEIAPDAEIIMLLRLGFLESKKRREFWKRHPLTQLYPLLNRPSFTGHGTDAAAYGWFVWSKYRSPLIKSI